MLGIKRGTGHKNSRNSIDVAVRVGSGSLRKKIIVYLKQNKHISFLSIIADAAEVLKYV